MTLLLIAYPDLDAEDRARLREIRRAHDPQYGIVEPHFTFVFPVAGIAAATFTAHVTGVLAKLPPIAFEFRQAIVIEDAVDARGHVCLLPGAGHDAMWALHSNLHTGPLVAYAASETPFVPHLTIACKDSVAAAQELAEELNQAGAWPSGVLRSFAVVEFDRGALHELERIDLGA
jgi:2'-5' RNA ligase